MASYIDLNDLGSFASINALWAAHPEGGQEGDYCTIDGVKYRWDKYDRMWVADPNFGPTPARSVTTFDGDVNMQNNLTVAGYIRAKGIKQPCLGLFLTEVALKAKWPNPEIGAWALVGESFPATVWAYQATTAHPEGEWVETETTAGPDDVDLSSITINGIRHYIVITDHADPTQLPEEPTDTEKGYGYLEGNKLYVYVGEGNGDSDTPGGLYKGVLMGETGPAGVGFASVAAHNPVDGAMDIILSNGDVMTIDLQHNHDGLVNSDGQTLKFYICEDETEYEGITTKDEDTLYLIPENAS